MTSMAALLHSSGSTLRTSTSLGASCCLTSSERCRSDRLRMQSTIAEAKPVEQRGSEARISSRVSFKSPRRVAIRRGKGWVNMPEPGNERAPPFDSIKIKKRLGKRHLSLKCELRRDTHSQCRNCQDSDSLKVSNVKAQFAVLNPNMCSPRHFESNKHLGKQHLPS